jgi:hypothetical protein
MIDAHALLQEVRENHARLIACARHDFQPVKEPGRHIALVRKYRCAACQGWVDASAKIWYDRGLQHAAEALSGQIAVTGLDT